MLRRSLFAHRGRTFVTRTGDEIETPRPRRVQLTVEWWGDADEWHYGHHLAELIERDDRSRLAKVDKLEALTSYGSGKR